VPLRDGPRLDADAGRDDHRGAGSDTITIEMIEAAQTLAGISFTREEPQAIATRLNATPVQNWRAALLDKR
jgi:hypothetical protein